MENEPIIDQSLPLAKKCMQYNGVTRSVFCGSAAHNEFAGLSAKLLSNALIVIQK